MVKLLHLHLMLTTLTQISSCSNFIMDNDFVISARTMDLGVGLSFGIGTTPVSSQLGTLAFPTARHGFVGFVPIEVGIVLEHLVTAGLNSVGVSCDQQTLLHTVYPNATGNTSTDVGIDYFCEYVLGNVENITSLQSDLLHKRVTPHGASVAGGQHFVVRDASGDSLVVEFLDGTVTATRDQNDQGKSGFGVMTNEPSFSWQVENARHAMWKLKNARPSFTIPGAFYPDERFLRIHLFKSVLPTPKTNVEAIQQAVHVMNGVTVPGGNQMGTDSSKGEGEGDHTLFGVVYDHAERVVYWRTQSNQNLQRLRLVDAKISLKNETRGKILFGYGNNDLPWYHDASSSIKRK